jgi:integrase
MSRKNQLISVSSEMEKDGKRNFGKYQGIYYSVNSKGETEYFGKLKINYKIKQVNLTKNYNCKNLTDSINKLQLWKDNLINGISENYNSFDKTLDNYFMNNFEKIKKNTEHSKDMLSVYNNYISKEIGHMTIDKIQNQDVQKIINKLERLDKLSNRSIRRVQETLRPCFNQMIKERVINHNPSTFLVYSEKLSNERELEYIIKSNLLDTLKYILVEVEKIENKQYKLMFYLTIYCVRRLGEVLSLEWDQVDLEEQSIVVYKDKSKNKTNTKYYVVDKIVKLMKEIREEKPTDIYVFQTPVQRKDKKDLFYSDSTIRDLHRKIVNKLEKEGKIVFYDKHKYSNEEKTILNIRPHDYRHFFGNIFRPISQDLLMIKSILSHTDKDITTRYSQYTFDFIKKGLIDYYNLLNDIKVDNK